MILKPFLSFKKGRSKNFPGYFVSLLLREVKRFQRFSSFSVSVFLQVSLQKTSPPNAPPRSARFDFATTNIFSLFNPARRVDGVLTPVVPYNFSPMAFARRSSSTAAANRRMRRLREGVRKGEGVPPQHYKAFPKKRQFRKKSKSDSGEKDFKERFYFSIFNCSRSYILSRNRAAVAKSSALAAASMRRFASAICSSTDAAECSVDVS